MNLSSPIFGIWKAEKQQKMPKNRRRESSVPWDKQRFNFIGFFTRCQSFSGCCALRFIIHDDALLSLMIPFVQLQLLNSCSTKIVQDEKLSDCHLMWCSRKVWKMFFSCSMFNFHCYSLLDNNTTHEFSNWIRFMSFRFWSFSFSNFDFLSEFWRITS